MAPNCRRNNGVCDLETFMREVSLIGRTDLLYGGEKVLDPVTHRPIKVAEPDFDQVNWEHVGEGDDLSFFTEEMDKSEFRGDFKNDVLFRNWQGSNSFDGVMSKAEEITKNAISKYQADGRVPAQDIIGRIFSAIQIHAAARESDLAQSVTAEFVRFLEGKGFTAVLTDPIEKPPLPAYQEWDVDRTISENQGKDGFNAEFEQQVRNFVQVTTSTGRPKAHFKAVIKALNVYENLAMACSAL